MKDIKLLVFDIDGTLIDRSKNTVEDSAVAAIEKAKENGYKVIIATGRTYFFVVDDILDRIKPQYLVTTNGAVANKLNGEIIREHFFDRKNLRQLIEISKEYGYPIGVKYGEVIATYHLHDEYVSGYIGHEVDKKHLIIDDSNFDYFNKNHAHGIFLFAPYDFQNFLKKKFPQFGIAQAEAEALEIFPEAVDKTAGIEEVIQLLGYNWDQVITFGDGHNDVQMLTKAKIGVAMGNADNYVKSHADYITTPILEDGIAHALKNLGIV